MFDETFDGLQDLGIAPMVWSPLGGGRLFSQADAHGATLRAVIQEVADRLDQSFASVVFAWIMMLPSRPMPLTGSGKIASVAAAVAAHRLHARAQRLVRDPARGARSRGGLMPWPSRSRSSRASALTAQQKKDLLNRLARIEGQLRGVQKLIALAAEPADCEAVAQQMAAARKALDRSFVQLLTATVVTHSDGAEDLDGRACGGRAAGGPARQVRLNLRLLPRPRR